VEIGDVGGSGYRRGSGWIDRSKIDAQPMLTTGVGPGREFFHVTVAIGMILPPGNPFPKSEISAVWRREARSRRGYGPGNVCVWQPTARVIFGGHRSI